MIGIQVQLTLLNRLILTKQQQEQEQIPESPSPSPAPSAVSNPRGTISRSRHSSISHASTTAPLEEERSHDSSLTMDDGLRGSLNNVSVVESNNSQSACIVS